MEVELKSFKFQIAFSKCCGATSGRASERRRPRKSWEAPRTPGSEVNLKGVGGGLRWQTDLTLNLNLVIPHALSLSFSHLK